MRIRLPSPDSPAAYFLLFLIGFILGADLMYAATEDKRNYDQMVVATQYLAVLERQRDHPEELERARQRAKEAIEKCVVNWNN